MACLMPICLIAGSGDVNGDGIISKADIDAIIDYIMKTSQNVTKESADVNEDGDVNAADIVELINLINQPVIITEDIGDWSEMRVSADGSLITVKNMVGRETPEEVLMILPSAELGVLYSHIKFDENEVPKYITLNDNIIIIDSYDGYIADLTVVYENITAYSVKGIPFSSSGVSKTRAANENNMVRNTTAWVELASGVVGVVGGSLLVAGSIVSEAGTFGATTPISVPGVLAGSATIAGGCSTFKSGWDKLWVPGAHNSNIGETIGFQATSELISNGPQNAYVPDQYFAYLKDPNYSSQLSKAGWINFIVGLTAGIADNIYGRTVTWDDQRNFYYQKDENGNAKVVTGLSKDITLNSATVRGFISPSITVSQLNGSSLENEYGIVVVSASDSNDRYIQKSSGSGGLIEFTFNNLKPNTVYNYRTYYLDKTNVISLLGEIMTFQTKQYSLPTISDFKVTKSQYSEGAFSNNGKTYDYCYNASVTISFPLADRENVEDWGYVYKDPDGKTKKISTTTTNAEFVDNRYAYYRNQPKSTACLYTYVKYKNMDEIIYGDPTEYDLIYADTFCPDNNHPHMIDLGLPSRKKWSCCNIGASSPSEVGGYYAWGETETKPQYGDITYKFFINYVTSQYGDWVIPVYTHIGTDICGTNYDVAHVKWGYGWRMPTMDEIKELKENCSSSWYILNGKEGRLYIGSNGNRIFLPAGGWYTNSFHSSNHYWSSTLDPYDTSCESSEYGWYPYVLDLDDHSDSYCSRGGGIPIRPIISVVASHSRKMTKILDNKDGNKECHPIIEKNVVIKY